MWRGKREPRGNRGLTPSSEPKRHCTSGEAPPGIGCSAHAPARPPLISCHSTWDGLRGKGTPAASIPLYWPYISAGCRCHGPHPEKLQKAKATRWEDRREGTPQLTTSRLLSGGENASCSLITRRINAKCSSELLFFCQILERGDCTLYFGFAIRVKKHLICYWRRV